ncbi:MAG TPA: ABC transporter permease [Candidatus Deferrimicrobium sp.]|nr:ABC transporter permease [Candidatus Deferrimicrobium sp.]
MRRLRFIAQKEVHHILRDPRSLTIVMLMPVLMTFLYGYAINMDIENIVLSVIDHDRSSESRRLDERLFHSKYFSRPSVAIDERDPQRILKAGQAHAVLVIPPGFAAALHGQETVALSLTIDGSDNNVAAAAQSYIDQVLARYFIDQLPPKVSLPGVTVSPRILYNPDLKSSHFVVPALVALFLLMVSALLTSVTLAREKETGTMEQLLMAPVKPIEILVGKLLPYVVIAFIDALLVLAFAKIVFGVPFVGSRLLLLGLGLVYIVTSLGIGILISSLVRTQQVAMMLAATTTLMPSVMLSGFIFAIKNMPTALQLLSRIIPARYFVTIIRGIMLKGAGAEVLAVQGISLIVLMAIMVAIAARQFSTRVN